MPASSRRQESLYALESLEPRLLLSGDPVLAELARWSQDDGQQNTETPVVIVQEIDQNAAALTAAGGTDSGAGVAWPAGWHTAAENAAAASSFQVFASGEGELDLSTVLAELLDKAMGADHAADVASQIRAAASQYDSGGRFADGMALSSAGGDTIALGIDELNAILDQVLEPRSADGQGAQAAGLTIHLADLGDNVVAEYRDGIIYLDIDAAGRGWFIAQAPLEASDAEASADLTVTAAPFSHETDAARSADEMSLAADELSADPADTTRMKADGDDEANVESGLVLAPEVSAEGTTDLTQAVVETDTTSTTGQSPDSILDTAGNTGGSSQGEQALAATSHREGLLELLGAALGIQDSAQDDSTASEHVVAVLAASQRLQEENRISQRSSAWQKHDNHNSDDTADDTSGVSPATESTTVSEQDRDQGASPRGPPAITEIQTVSADENTETDQTGSSAPLYYQQDNGISTESAANQCRAPPADDHIADVSDDVADMPRAPPADENSHAPSVTVTNDSGNSSESEITHDEVDYLSSTGIPGGLIGEDLTLADISSDARLLALVNEAIARWNASGLTTVGFDLTTLTYAISDLATGALASFDSSTHTITIDGTADGFGWFVDDTPTTDGDVGSAPGVDLLTALMHEVGHALGYVHPGATGLRGNAVMVATLTEGVRLSLQIVDGTRLNDVINVILATFDSTSPPVMPQVFSSADALVPNLVTVGTTAVGGTDLQLEGITLTFAGLSFDSTSGWTGDVQVEAGLGVLLPGHLDIMLIDDNFSAPIRVESASAAAGSGPREVTFVLYGDLTDLVAGEVIAVLNSNESGFDDADFADARTITIVSTSYDQLSDRTTLVVDYNFDPGNLAWTGGSVIALAEADATDDADLDAVFGTIYLAAGDGRSLLRMESLKAADLGWPGWLDIQITDLKLEFTDFRVDDSQSSLKLDAAFRGIDTGVGGINLVIRKLFIVEGSASGVVFDMDILAEGQRNADGAVWFKQNPILDLSGIAGRIKADLTKVGGNIGFDVLFIVKSVGIDMNGNMTSDTALIERTIMYAALGGELKYGGVQPAGPADKDGKLPPKVGGYDFGFRLAISELGPLQLYVFAQTNILLDPVSGLSITELRGGISFFSTVEDKQVRPPYTATGGSASASGDLQSPVRVTLTLPGHNLKPGDEIRVLSAGDPDLVSNGRDTFVVATVNGDDITYLTGGSGYEPDFNNYAFGGTIEVRKVSISDPFDLTDPGFGASKLLTLEQWETQLDQQVVIQANLGSNLWLGLLSNLVIEAGATLSLAPRIPSSLVSFDVDLLLDTQGHIMLTGTMNLAFNLLKVPVRIFADLSNVGDGSFSMLFLAELPKGVAGLDPLVVIYAGVTFETIINGVPATLDALTGFPSGVGSDVTAATINDLSGTGAGPWAVTFTLNSTTADSQFTAGDTIAVVGSDPDSFNGNYLITDATASTVTFMVGNVVQDGRVDVDYSGAIDALDNSILNGIPVIAGLLDYNKDGVVDANDDGEIFNFINDASGNRRVVSYAVTDGYIDVDGDSTTGADADDDVVIGINPQVWTDKFDLTRNIVEGRVDVDGNGIIDIDDFGSLGSIVVANGLLDINRDGIIDNTDDGIIQNVVIDAAGNRAITSYHVIDGYLDIDGDIQNPLTDAYVVDADDILALNLATDQGGYWIEPGFAVANTDDLGDGLRISLNGGVDVNIPFVTSLSLNGSATMDFIFGGAEDVRVNFKLNNISLSETNVGAIGTASGDLTLTMHHTGGPVVGGVTLPKVEIWGAAIVTSNFSFLEQFGLFANVSGLFIINSSAQDKAPITLATTGGSVMVTPTRETFSLRMDGTLGLRVDFNSDQNFTVSEQLFLLTGTFVFSISSAQGLNIALFSESGPASSPTVGPATLEIGPNGAPWLKFNAFGFLAIQKINPLAQPGDLDYLLYGVAANIILSLDASAPGVFANVASIDAQFVLMLNTTLRDVTFNIPAGAQDPGRPNIATSLIIPRAPPSSILNANLNIENLIAGTAWSLTNEPGAPYLLIHLGGTDPATNPDATLNIGPFSLSGQFSFLIGAEVDPTTFAVTPLLEIIAHVDMDISVGSLTLFELEGDAFIRYDSNGLVAAINMTQRQGFSFPGNLGFTLGSSTSFRLELNTTGQGFDHDNNPTTAAIAQGFRLHIDGTMDLAGILVLTGTFDLSIDQNGVQLHIDASITLFGIKAGFIADATLTQQGFTLNASLSLATPGLTVVSGLFSVTGGFTLHIDTINDRYSISVHAANNPNAAASVNLMGLVLSGKMTIGIDANGFYINIPNTPSAALTLDFFGVASLKVSGSFNYDNNANGGLGGAAGNNSISFSASASILIGVEDVLGVGGNISVSFSNANGNTSFTGSVSGTFWIAGLSLSASGNLKISSKSISLTLSVSATITPGFWFWDPWNGSYYVAPVKVTYSHTFNIGTVTPPSTYVAPAPPPPVLAHVANGTLYLHMGVDSGLRDPNDDWDDDDLNESFRVTHVSGSVGNETVLVDAFGFKQTYAGVSTIMVTNAAGGDDVIDIALGVLADAEIHGGVGLDSITYYSSGRAHLYGDDDADFLAGGSGGTQLAPDEIYGGRGDDRLLAGSGYSDLYGEDGNDTLVWNQASGAVLGVIDGGNDAGTNFRDTLMVIAGNAADLATISAATAGDFTVSFGSGFATSTAIESLILDLMGGGDGVTVNDVTATSLNTVLLRIGQNDNQQDNIVLLGSTAAETIRLQTTTQLVDVLDNQGNVTGQVTVESVALEHNKGTKQVKIAIEQSNAAGGNLATGDLLSVYGNGGNDNIDASLVTALLLNMQFILGNDGGSILGSANDDLIEITVTGNTTGNLQLDGKGGADSYIFNLKGGNTDTLITINDTGSTGTDSVIVNGTGGAEIISLSNVQFRQGTNSEVLNYSGLESFTIDSLGGNDDITIYSTSPGTSTVVNSGDGVDRIAIRSVANTTTINTGTGDDRISVGSMATVSTNSGGDVNSINALLTVIGGGDADSLFVDDSGDTLANTNGVLTSAALTGLGMVSGISYSEIEDLAIDLGLAADAFLIQSTHLYRTTVNGNSGNDTLSVRSLSGATTVNTGAGSDQVNVGSNASSGGNSGGTANAISARLTVNGGNSGADVDVLDVDDSSDGLPNIDGLLSDLQLNGLGMSHGIGYSALSEIRIHLGAGADVFTILSTHAGDTRLDGNNGNDVINVRSISGATLIDAGDGSDHVNVGSTANGTTAAQTTNSGGNVNGIGASLILIGNTPASGSDTLTVDDTGDNTANTGTLTATTLTGLGLAAPGISYSSFEHLMISLGIGSNSFTIENTHGTATTGTLEDTTLNSGNGADTVYINGATDQLLVNAQDAADIINVRGMTGTVTVNGDAGNDTINVSSQSPQLPGSATDAVGTVDGIAGLLIVNGGAGGNDILNVDDSNPAITGKTGTLTGTTLRGLGMPNGINYGSLETLNIWLDAGNNSFNIDGTHGGTTNIYGMEGADTINVRATATGSTTNIYTQGDNDTINLSDMAALLPASYPASLPPPAADTVGNIDAINGLVVIDGGLDTDTINIDDSANSADKAAILTAATLRGLDLEAGVNYTGAEVLNIWLGTGTDTFYIDSTHTGSTRLYTGDGTAAAGQRDDTVAVRSISGITTIHGQAGNEGFLVNVQYNGGVPPLVGTAAANDAQFLRTHENNIAAVLNLHGEGDSDHYTVNLAGTGNALVNVHDNGAAANGADTLVINGADSVAGISNQPHDTFLLRRDFVALLNDSNPADSIDFDRVERVNYNADINAGLIVNGLGGNDAFYTDDNSSITTLTGGSGADSFQIGQVFGTERTIAASIAPADVFDTTPVIIGIIRDPLTNQVIFNPVVDALTDAVKADILAAIAISNGLNQPLDGIAYVSTGVTFDTTALGGDGDDSFSVYHNIGALTLKGEGDNDDFIVRAFVVLTGPGQGNAQVNGGSGGDTIQYAQNAPVSIDGGDGFDTIVALGTPFNDSFVVTSQGIFGAGLTVYYDNVESVELDTLEGNDTIYILSTSASLVTTIIGGQGSDTINVLGDVVNNIVTNDPNADNLQDQNLGAIQGPLVLEGGALADRDRSLAAAVVLPGELNPVSGQESPFTNEANNIDILNIFHADNLAVQSGALLFRDNSHGIANTGLALTGFGMGSDLTIDEGSVAAPQLVTYGGGITYASFEIIEMLLGSGNETLDILATADAAITAVHGGGGNDTIYIHDRGAGPLIVYGDTSEDGLRYSNNSGAASVHATSFSNTGNDTINAAAMADQGDAFAGVVIYGGPGDDTLTGSQGNDHIAGGSGSDTINGAAGNDHIYGDSHFNVNLLLFVQDQISRFDTATQLADINAIFTVPTTGTGAADILSGGSGNDVIFGDHGIIGQTDGTRRLESTGNLVLLQTTNLANGGSDTVHGDAGNDFIFGGVAGDTIYGDADSDLVFGDFGSVAGNVDATLIGTLDGAGVQNAAAAFTYTSDISAAADATAGNDTLYGGSLAVLDTDTGHNILLGQQGSDTIFGGGSDDDIYGGHNVANGTDSGDFIDGATGNDVILGDNGLIEHTAVATDPRFAVLTGSLIYDSNGNPLVAGAVAGRNPAGVEARRILLFDHDNSAANAGNFGNDVIAGGADDDVILGQLGDDTLHGDGQLAGNLLASLGATVAGSDVGGDDYIEGNGGSDTILGGLGQDDLIGGSSSLYGPGSPSQRPDGTDTIFGGNADLLARNNFGETLVNAAGDTVIPEAARHARDSDMILGDNGNIYRLVGTNSVNGGSLLSFAYDNYAAEKIAVRAALLLDYTPGGGDFDAAAAAGDIGAADIIHGEAGDDFIYGMVGSDILYGDAQDDDLVGGYGHDWISGGTGSDGVLGDDGRIYTSRNTAGDPTLLSESLYGIYNVEVDRSSDTLELRTPGDLQQAFVNKLGALTRSVNLTPFNVAPNTGAQYPLYDPQYADDIIYGGLGDDFLHGGAGDDAMSGAEALAVFYNNPLNTGDVLRYGGERAGEFSAYNEFDPLRHILVDQNGVHTDASDAQAREFLLNFDAFDSNALLDPYSAGTGYAAVPTDGDDRLFGDLGNDWLVGGTGRDHLYGGYGDDLLNADDNHASTAGSADPRANNVPDTHPSYEDIAYGGAGRDVLIANTGGDRLIDWVGEFNSYIVPFAPFGAFTISRSLAPQLMEYLYDLSKADGADQTRAADTGADVLRNGEPEGELGLVMQKDIAWQDQTGAPDDIQPGNIPGGARDVIRAADFNNTTTAVAFAADSGSWTVQNGRLQISPDYLGGDAVSVFYVDSALPGYFEIRATINAGKPTTGLKSNTYLIFDYQSPTDFKFAGINISTDKLVMGHRTAEGWIVDEQTPARLKPGQDYNVLLALNGTVATLVVNNADVFSHVYATRTDIYGVSYGLNAGLVGIGSENSIGSIDNVAVQVLPPELTLDETEDFTDGVADRLNGLMTGQWTIINDRYTGQTSAGETFATSAMDMTVAPGYVLRLGTTLQTQGVAGLVFDQYSTDDFKFAALSVATDEVLIGHYTVRGGWQIDASVVRNLNGSMDYDLEITLKGTTISVVLNGQTVLGHAFNAPLVDGAAGLLAGPAGASYDSLTVQSNDPALGAGASQPLQASGTPDSSLAVSNLQTMQLAAIVDAAILRWQASGGLDDTQLATLAGLKFGVTELGGATLGLAVHDTLYIDATAAGFGWFIDATPDDDAEFADPDGDGVLTALAGSAADGRMDLLSVVMHELGHLLGEGHSDTSDALMHETLVASTRTADSLTSDSMPAGSACATDWWNTLLMTASNSHITGFIDWQHTSSSKLHKLHPRS